MKPVSSLLFSLLFLLLPTVALSASGPCHPDLFGSSQRTAGLLDHHTDKILQHATDLIKNNPQLTTGETKIWEGVENGIDRKFILTLNADGSYSFELQLGQASANPNFVTIETGTLVTTADPETTTTSATLMVDYDALHSVVPAEKATGQVAATFNIVNDPSKPAPGIKASAAMILTNLLFDQTDPHGPRNGIYLYLHEPGVGGYFNFQDTLKLLCPTNPGNLTSNEQVVSRWYVTSDGGQHSRSDAMATAGVIAPGDQAIGLQCAAVSPFSNIEIEYILSKIEGPNGNTLSGDARGPGNCDPVFGQVPALTNNATDFNFSAALSFPNEW